MKRLVIFGWMPDSVNFMMLSAGYFCIHVTILDICSGIHLTGNSLIFSDMALKDLLGGNGMVFSLALTIHHY